MKGVIYLAAWLSLLLSGSSGLAQSVFKIGVVFTPSSLNAGPKDVLYGQIVGAIGTTFANSGLGSPTFVLYPNLASPFTNVEQLRAHPTDNPSIRQWRDDNQVDLVVIVNSTIEGTACGSTQLVPASLPDPLTILGSQITAWGLFSHADTRYVAIVTNQKCPTPSAKIAAHEVGHLLFGDHQSCMQNPNNCPTPDNDSVPALYNHGYRDTNTSLVTIMHEATSTYGEQQLVFSSPGNVFPGTSIVAGSMVADNERVLVESTLPYTAMFRPKPGLFSPPNPPICFWEYTGCQNNTKQFFVSWSGGGSGAAAISKVVMEKSPGGAPWSSLYAGDLACAPTAQTQTTAVRVFGITVGGGFTPYCQVTLPGGTGCGDEQPW